MAGKTHTAESAAAAIAARQHGLVTRNQLRACRIGDNTIDRWVSWGRLHRVTRSVFGLGEVPIDDHARLMAAALSCSSSTSANERGPSAVDVVVSHRSAGFLLRLAEPLPRVIDVVCSGQAGRGIDGIRPHFVEFPGPGERGWVEGIPCTSVARTLVDLAGVLGEPSLREAVERAAANRALDLAAVEAVLVRGRRRGDSRLRSILEEWRPVEKLARSSRLRSPFEARLLLLLAAGGTVLPEVNARVRVAEGTLEVDLLWRDQRVVVEADSRRHHGIEVAFERDRRRDRELIDAGFIVIRVTWRQAEREAEQIAASVRRLLNR